MRVSDIHILGGDGPDKTEPELAVEETLEARFARHVDVTLI